MTTALTDHTVFGRRSGIARATTLAVRSAALAAEHSLTNTFLPGLSLGVDDGEPAVRPENEETDMAPEPIATLSPAVGAVPALVVWVRPRQRDTRRGEERRGGTLAVGQHRLA
jgi:hypothetical protein